MALDHHFGRPDSLGSQGRRLADQCLSWVKTGKAQREHMFSALPPTTDVTKPLDNHSARSKSVSRSASTSGGTVTRRTTSGQRVTGGAAISSFERVTT
jgi:hypothetical protein